MSGAGGTHRGAPPIRILVVDDHPVVREGIVTMLTTERGLAVAGQAGNGVEAIEAFASLDAKGEAPDVVLLDLEMPGGDGIEAIERLRASHPEVPIIVFTAFDTDERIFGAVRAGARGYLLKGVPRQELFEAIRIVHGGGSLLQPVVASKLMQRMSEEEEKASFRLSPREKEVLELLSKGLQNREIAKHLDISERTAKFHVSAILTKLDVSNRTEAVSLAMQMGLLA